MFCPIGQKDCETYGIEFDSGTDDHGEVARSLCRDGFALSKKMDIMAVCGFELATAEEHNEDLALLSGTQGSVEGDEL